MDLNEAVILGIVQGATEFLPISSSGHAILVPALLGLSRPDLNAVVIAHLGTLAAVVVYFFRDLWQIFREALISLRAGQPMATAESRLGWYIAAGTIPAAVVGFLFEDWFEAVFTQDPRWPALFLIGTAVILLIGERLRSGWKQLAGMEWRDAWIIGLCQTLALLPGISRSGSTIMAGLGRGLNRELAARYSFLLSVPIILGAGILQLPELLTAPDLAGQLPLLTATFITSALVGFVCIHFLIVWLRQRSLYPFAAYCALFGAIFLLIPICK